MALERLVEPAERRAAIAGDEGRGAQAAPRVGAVLVERQAHQRLDARKGRCGRAPACTWHPARIRRASCSWSPRWRERSAPGTMVCGSDRRINRHTSQAARSARQVNASAASSGRGDGQSALGDDAVAVGVGMDAVGLVEARGRRATPSRKNGMKATLAPLGHLLVHPLEVAGIARAVVRRQPHAGEEHAGAAGLEARHDRRRGWRACGEILAAEGVVGAELERCTISGLQLERPVHPPQPARGRVARHAGVDHAVRIALGAEPRREQRRIALARGDAESGGEAVAECDDDGVLAPAETRSQPGARARRREGAWTSVRRGREPPLLRRTDGGRRPRAEPGVGWPGAQASRGYRV